MSFREKVRKVMGRGSSSAGSPAESTSPSQDTSGVNTPSLDESTSITPLDRDNLTIDPRENPLTQVESNATAKKKSAIARLRLAMKKEDPYKDWPEDIYKPHELPRPKYRRPVDPEHADSLQSYNLRTAFQTLRRRSYLSQYSPMASRLPSRMGSFSSLLIRSAAPSRSHSFVGVVPEGDVDDNVSHVELSRQHSASIPIGRRRGDTVTANSTVPDLVQSSSLNSADTDSILNTSQPATIGDVSRSEDLPAKSSFDTPFDGEELTRALTRKLITQED